MASFEPQTIQIPDCEYMAAVTELRGHDEGHGAVFDLDLSPRRSGRDTHLLASASGDHSVRIFSLPSGAHVRTLFKNGGHVEWVTFCRLLGPSACVSAGLDGRVLLWAGARASEIAQIGSIMSGTSRESQGGLRILLAGSHGTVCMIGAQGGSVSSLWEVTLCSERDSVNSTAVGLFGARYAVVGMRNGRLCVLDQRTGETVSDGKVFAQGVITICDCEDVCAVGAADGRIGFLNDKGEVSQLTEPKRGRVTHFFYDGGFLFVARSDGAVELYEIVDGVAEERGEYDVTGGIPILSMIARFVGGGYRLYCALSDGRLVIYSLREEAKILSLPISRGGINKMLYSEELSALVCAGDDAIVRVLHLTGK